ncbi:hypothetical protein DFH11DRAFT_1246151 [Phellopilus nigrolimitatus]|nr:hypothetical protein DFH11DRAFT_1246151 [Phellopilus nigrolimitatus]
MRSCVWYKLDAVERVTNPTPNSAPLRAPCLSPLSFPPPSSRTLPRPDPLPTSAATTNTAHSLASYRPRLSKIMNTPSNDRSASSSPRATPGGTAVTRSQHAAHDDKHLFLHEQNSHEQHRPVSIEYSATTFGIDDKYNNEQARSVIDSPRPSRSARSSPSTASLRSSSTSLSSAPIASFQGLAESFTHMSVESPTVPPEQALMRRRSRVRELSAPLPSVPPSTPASVVVHRASFSQSHSVSQIPTASSLLRGSPAVSFTSLFSSPLTECSDSEHAEQDGETSDSNSIEIISGCVEDSFVTGRFEVREGGNVSRGALQPTRPCLPNVSPQTSNSSGVSNPFARPYTSRSTSASTITSASHTSTPHPQTRATHSPSHTAETESKSRISTSEASTFSHQFSNSSSPSRAQPRNDVSVENRLTHENVSPIVLDVSAPVPIQDSHSVPEAAPMQESDENSRTPNVYINGLPPHFPDESLYLMTRDFGHVLSVRTFTRCVGEKMSGYGFVLFDSIESAGRCIETLRKYRNLHPSFSKQVHKIPGTPYASGTITIPPAGSLSSLSSQPSLTTMVSFPSMTSTLVSSLSSTSFTNPSSPTRSRGHRVAESISTNSGSDFSGKDLTFREKMEKLKDGRSTNLYMEGLPLTIDDVSLAALVSPHKIVSSRFFQTKLSDPPRMIAFVRLESRQGADEVIDRLHGRVVRGWNDNGCRISVRFADSNEQRELRRAERLARGEDEDVGGTARLSMAHAALLNLRGAEAQVQLNAHALQKHGQARSPLDLQNSQLTNNNVSNLATIAAFHPMTIVQDQDLKNAGAVSKAYLSAAQHHCQDSPLPPHGANAYSHSPGMDALGAHMNNTNPALVGKKSNVCFPSNGGRLSSLSTKSFEANQLALLQQQAQLQQLQLLQQMQNASRPEWQGIDPNYAFNTHAHILPHALMPSVDILTTQMNDSHSQVGGRRVPAHQIIRGQSAPCIQQEQTRSYTKAGLSEHSGTTFQSTNNVEHQHGRRAGEDYVAGHQYARTAHSSHHHVSGYASSHAHRSDADHHEMVSGANRRRIGVIEEGEVTLVSPALTYTSRTPSTLSPATPLFNAFGTPASAPATVSLGKTSIREREHSRSFKTEFRQ